MKTVFLSIVVLIYGYFCDMCRKLCQKGAEYSLKKGRGLTDKPLIILSKLTERNAVKWRRIESRLIYLLLAEQIF